MQDVGIRLAQGVHDLRIDENLAPTREAISKSLATGTESVWRAYSNIRADLTKRQADYREKRDREQKEKEKEEPPSVSSPPLGTTGVYRTPVFALC